MELQSAYIRAYGNLQDLNIPFNESLTSFLEPNGYGKTTLASYIRSMFYGRDKNDRKRYLPYSGNDCGGSLSFSFENNEYRIERGFGKKPSEDTLALFRNNTEIETNGKEPGFLFFGGFDVESFNKTLFLTPSDLKIEATDTIKGKIGKYTDGTEEGFSFDKVLSSLEDYRKEFKPKRSSETKGKIADIKSRLNSLREEKVNLGNRRKSLEEKYKELKDKKEELSSKKNEKEEAEKKNQEIFIYDSYKEKKDKTEKAEKQFEEQKIFFPAGVPSIEETSKIISLFTTQIPLLTKQKKGNAFSPEEENQYQIRKERFKNGVPGEDELTKADQNIDSLKSLSNTISPFSASDENILRKYASSTIDINRLVSAYNRYEELKAHRAIAKEKKKKPTLSILLGVLSFILLLSGILLGIRVSPFCYIRTAGGIALIPVRILKAKKKPKENESDKEFESLKNELIQTLGTEDTIESSYNRLKEEYSRYQHLLEQKDKIDKKNKEDDKKRTVIQSFLSSFFCSYGYGLEDNLSKSRNQLRADIQNYQTRIKREDEYQTRNHELQNEIDQYKAQVEAFEKKYQIDTLNGIQQRINNYNQAEQLFKIAKEELKEFLDKNPINPEKAEEDRIKTDLSILSNEISDLDAKIHLQEKEINGIETDVEQLEQDVSEIPALEQEYKNAKAREAQIGLTIEYLKKAEDNIKKKYIEPRQNRFLHYADRIEKTTGDKIQIDADYNLSINEKGSTKESYHLSSGQLTIVLLCYRLALLDNIFKTDKPFLILDDFFLYLDETHRNKASLLLKELSKDHQILYFTCHPSRQV